MESQIERTQPLQLHFQSKEKILVTSDDEDRFLITAGEAALACKRDRDDKEWNEQFNALLFHVHKWCDNHSDKVGSGFVSVSDIGLNVLICLMSEKYDFDLEDDLVELDLALSEQYPYCTAEVLQIPNQKALTSELSVEAMCVYGDGKRSPTSGTA